MAARAAEAGGLPFAAFANGGSALLLSVDGAQSFNISQRPRCETTWPRGVSPGCAIKKSINRHQPATFSRVLFIEPTNVPQPHRSQQRDTSGNNRSHQGVNRLF
jgi:hypothetical protein